MKQSGVEEKRIGSDPIKTLHNNGEFIVRLYDNNCINIMSVHGPQYYSVSVQLDDTPKEFEQIKKKGHINVRVKDGLDMWANGKEIKG
tara:strand:+ start:659 stop:922 length:264 start_codon:yes stop_codon:yes gene_type:complete